LNHVFFHNDVDGIMSAALFLCYQVNREFDYRESILYPVQSTMRGGSIQKTIDKIPKNESIAILDFEFNPMADIWFDHHFSEQLGPNRVNTGKIFYDSSAKSAVEIIAKEFEFKDVGSIIDMVNMIDSASYPDVKFIFESDHPLMILRAYLETAFPSDMMYARIVEVIMANGCDVEKSLRKMRIDYSCVRNIRNLASKISKDMLVFGKCSVVHQTRQNLFPRYAEYYAKPETQYAMRISLSGPNQKYIQVGHNQWCGKKNTINLGEFMRKLSYVRGGGHFNVAAGVILNSDEEKFLDDVDVLFNGEDMEKYGVDPKDPVEEKAQEMVKTGMDISDAREKAQEEVRNNAGSESELRT